MNVKPATQPLSLARSLLFFVVPLIFLTALFWGLVPLMDLMGVRLFVSFAASIGFSMGLLLFFSIRFFRREKRTWSRAAFIDRFRLAMPRGTDWLWTIVLVVIAAGGFQILARSSSWIAESFPQPKFLTRMLDQDPNYFMEAPLEGNWLLFAMTLFLILLNVCAQEFFFRGYLLPRQELAHGRSAWLIHGLMWAMFYLFLPWFVLRMVPAALAIPFVAQRLGNTWPGILAHFALFVPALANLASRL